jgi:DnaJ-class molecular chaperone
MKLTPQKTVTSNKGSTVTCDRCNGNGEYWTRLGKPGQDPREVGGYANIEWEEPTGPHHCSACKGTGQRKQKPTITGSFRIEDKPEHQFLGEMTQWP